jgi:hypothetical protein
MSLCQLDAGRAAGDAHHPPSPTLRETTGGAGAGNGRLTGGGKAIDGRETGGILWGRRLNFLSTRRWFTPVPEGG